MREEEDMASRRRTCREMKEMLRKALDIVNEVRDYNTFN
jgi:dynamin 1-like protein